MFIGLVKLDLLCIHEEIRFLFIIITDFEALLAYVAKGLPKASLVMHAYVFGAIGNQVLCLEHIFDPSKAQLASNLIRIGSPGPRASTSVPCIAQGTSRPPSELGSICKILDPCHELRPPHCAVAPLLFEHVIVPRKMGVEMSLKREVSDEALPAQTALELHRLINLCYRKHIEPITC